MFLVLLDRVIRRREITGTKTSKILKTFLKNKRQLSSVFTRICYDTQNFMRKIIILLFLVLSGHTYAGVIRVVNANDAGAGSLREAIEITAVPGDTIIIDGKGTILLQTQININSKSNLTICLKSLHLPILISHILVLSALVQQIPELSECLVIQDLSVFLNAFSRTLIPMMTEEQYSRKVRP